MKDSTPEPPRFACSRKVVGIGMVCVATLTAVFCGLYPRKARSALILLVEVVEHRFGSSCVGDLASSRPTNAPQNEGAHRDLPRLIAHAGGGIRGLTYTNSLEAMTASVASGCTVLEIDLAWTSDEKLVLLHDWGPAAGRHFGKAHQGKQMSYRQFLETPRIDGLTSLGEEELLVWLGRNSDARVVLDAKWRPMEAFERLHRLATTEIQKQLIAQAYQLDQMRTLREAGFAQVLLTLYRSTSSEEEILQYLVQAPPQMAGVAMPVDHALGPLGKKVAATGQPTFAHPVNSRWLSQRLARRGIGVFSSRLCACNALQVEEATLAVSSL